MEIMTKKSGKILIVSIIGRIDATSSTELEKKLTELISSGEIFLLLNFDCVEYISSAGLRVILSSTKKVKSQKGEVFICSLKGPVEEVFKLTGFQSIFKVFDSEEEALLSIGNG